MRLPGELDPDAAAANYEDIVRELVHADYAPPVGDLPRFDLILLGMGSDGHTASLFPGTEALHERTRLVVANRLPAQNAVRLSFTYPLINAARRVLFLVRGEDKAATLRDVLSGPYRPDRLPCQGVQLLAGTVTWLVDAAAFAEVQSILDSEPGPLL
jgi:6-phosphogluconolactonase